MMGVSAKRLPTTTVLPARLRMCQPTQRPAYMTGEKIVTSWGWCKVTGRIGQRHQDVMDAFMWNATATREIEDGGIELLVDPAKVRRTLSDAGYSLGRLRLLIDDLMSVTVELKVTGGLWAIGGLIDHVIDSDTVAPNPMGGGDRHLWQVRLGTVFVRLLKQDLPLYYDPAPIARLASGVSQAVARHVLTHSRQPNGGWLVDGLIEATCGELNAVGLRHRRRELKNDTEMLAKVGIVIDGDRVYRGGRACSTGPIKTEKAPKCAAPARCRAAPARQNVKTCSSGPVLQISSEIFRADASATEVAATSAKKTPPAAADAATTPQGVNSPAGEGFFAAATAAADDASTQHPSPAGSDHPQRGSALRQRRRGVKGSAMTQQLEQLDLF